MRLRLLILAALSLAALYACGSGNGGGTALFDGGFLPATTGDGGAGSTGTSTNAGVATGSGGTSSTAGVGSGSTGTSATAGPTGGNGTT